MATINNTSIVIPKAAQEGIIKFFSECYNLYANQFNIRAYLEEIDRAYLREADKTTEHRRAVLANKYGDSNKFQNITLPIVLEQVETAVTTQTEIFLSGSPIFAPVSSPDYIDQALQMESIIYDQQTKGSWVSNLQRALRDGFKYNYGPVEISWDRDVTYAVETDLAYDEKQGRPKEVIWEGNKIKRLDPYNTFTDTRVPLTEMPRRAEFTGYVERVSRVDLKNYIHSLPDKIIDNIKSAFESCPDEARFYTPTLASSLFIDNSRNSSYDTNWSTWFSGTKGQGSIEYKNSYERYVLYARIIPSDFGIKVAASNTPQIWKFIIINGKTLILAERQTNAHNLIPVLFMQPHSRGLSYQDKPLAADVKPIQEFTTALANSVIAARRRAISDRLLYDPSKINPKDINSDSPNAKIPAKPAAYGKPLSESVYQSPYRDDQSGIILQELPVFSSFADRISGQNQAQQGRFVKGNKTRQEFSDIMGAANAKPKAIAMLLEDDFFTPAKEIIKLNILQFQGGISLLTADQKKTVQIDPVSLRKAVLNFKMADGLTPSEQIMNEDAWQVALQVVTSNQSIAQSYDFAKMFSYLVKLKGADISPFEKSKEEIQYEQALAVWQQMKQLSLEKGVPFNDPMPKPQDYGVMPSQSTSTNQPPEGAPQ